jgi:hypothetical protein
MCVSCPYNWSPYILEGFLFRKFRLKVVATNLILICNDLSLINVEIQYSFLGSKSSLSFLMKP